VSKEGREIVRILIRGFKQIISQLERLLEEGKGKKELKTP